MSVFLAQLKMENRLFIRSLDGLFWTLLFPAFFILLFGLIYGQTVWDDIRAIDYLLPGIIIMALMVTGIMYTTVAFVEDRAKGVYRRLSLTPIGKHIVILAQLANRFLLIVAQSALLVIVGTLVFQINLNGNWLLFVSLVSLGALCFLSIGMALTGLIKSSASANAISMIVFFTLMFLGGIFFPVEVMPPFISHVANVLPSTHLADALREVIIYGNGIGDIWVNVVVTIGWVLGAFLIAVKTFRWE